MKIEYHFVIELNWNFSSSLVQIMYFGLKYSAIQPRLIHPSFSEVIPRYETIKRDLISKVEGTFTPAKSGVYPLYSV